MATKIEWQPSDYAAKEILGTIIEESGLSYRAIESRAGGIVSYARFRDIVVGRRAPVRLSEFLAICEVCQVDPVQTLRDIIREAERIQHERDQPTPIPTMEELEAAARRESELAAATLDRLNNDPYSLAAYQDPHKHDPDPDNIA